MRLTQKGSCHCGKVKISIAYAPLAVTECHCTICRRYAPLWAYYPVEDASFTGDTEVYVWGRKHIAFHRCGNCGCVVGWTPRGDYPERAINARMLDGFDSCKVTLYIEEDASV